jgi:hypothetical protein
MSKIKIINDKTIDSLGTIKQILYSGDTRKTYLFNEKNKTNFYTIIKEIDFNKDDKYIICSKLEVGEKYITYFRYDENNILVYERRYNKSKNTTNIRELFYQTEKGKIFLDYYKSKNTIQKTINFTTKKLHNGKK